MVNFNEDFQILKEIIKIVYAQIYTIENYGSTKHLYIGNERYVNAALENTIGKLEWAKEIINRMINNIHNLPNIENKNVILGYLNKAYHLVISLLQYTYNVQNKIRFGQDDSILLNKYANDAEIILGNIKNLITESSRYI